MKTVFLLVSLVLPVFITGSIISKPGYYLNTKNSFQQLKDIYHVQGQEWQQASRESAQQFAQQSAEKSSQQSVEQSSQQTSQESADDSRQAQASQQRRHSIQRQQEDQRSQNYEQQQYLQQNEKQHYRQKKYQPVQRKPARSSESCSEETREQTYSNRDVYRVPDQYLVTRQSWKVTPNKRSSQEMNENTSTYSHSDESGEMHEVLEKLRQRKHSLSSLKEDNSKQSNWQETNEIISQEWIENNDNTGKRSNSLHSKSRKWNSPRSSADDNQIRSNEVIYNREQEISVVPVKSKRDLLKIYLKAIETMKSISNERKEQIRKDFEDAVRTDNEDVHLNATQLLNKNQYHSEEHTVKTEDGYYLTLFRIVPKDKIHGVQNRPVVFLMHGLLGSADDWLLMGPHKSLAYLLADAGYDVWLGNARGNKYARHHDNKHPSQDDFWYFTIDEIALQDLPAMIDYALKISKQQKMCYVAHSQGTTAFFALAATRPAYNEKVIMMYALSPMAYMSKVRSPLFQMIAPSNQYHDSLVQQMGHGEFHPSKQFIRSVGGEMCEELVGVKEVCSNIYFVMSGVNVDNLDPNLIPVIMGHLPAGASIRQMMHYAQAVDSHEFMKYDFGSEINQAMYGQPQPPKYRMENVSTPVSFYYSEDDWLSHPEDVKRLQNELPNVKDVYKVPEEYHFNSMDFQFSKQAAEVVYQRLIKLIQEQVPSKKFF